MISKTHRPSFGPRVAYRDQGSAVKWLEQAFGFKPTVVAVDGEGKTIYAEMQFGNGTIHIGSEWGEIKSPQSIGGANTQTIAVNIDGEIDEHCERARAAGGKIIQEPADQFHGDRTYRVVDPEGHIWTVSQHLRDVLVGEMEAAVPGMKVVVY